MGIVSFCGKLCVVLVFTSIILLCVPGIPPHVSFSSFDVDPSQPREGPLAKNYLLDDGERLFEGHLTCPESIASRAKDEIFVSLHGGDIVRIWGQNFQNSEVVANLGPGCAGYWEDHICGRPLGLRFAKDGRLLIADAYLGIFALDVKTGEKERLVNPAISIDGLKPRLIDDLDVDDAGNIYWSDASTSTHLADGLIELVSDPSGRLVKYNSKTKRNEVLISDVHFANGVQLSPDQSFVLVSETFRHRVLRYWLKGPKAGTSDVFLSGLPGMPDNLRSRPEGGYYISLITTRDPNTTDYYETFAKLPSLRKVLTRGTAVLKAFVDLVNAYFPNKQLGIFSFKMFNLGVITNFVDNGETIVVEADNTGKIIGSLQGSSGIIKQISETQRVGDYLFFGSPYVNFLGRLRVGSPAKTRKPAAKVQTQSSNIKEEL